MANDLAHYTANFGPLRPGDLLLLIDTIESMTSRMRMDLKTIPTVDQRRAVITQVVQVCSIFFTFLNPGVALMVYVNFGLRSRLHCICNSDHMSICWFMSNHEPDKHGG